MASLALVDAVEQEVGILVLAAATSATYAVLKRLGLPTRIARASALLDGSR
jgi:hypothetical protein